MAWTTPATVVAGQLMTAAFWNTHVRDNEVYLDARFVRTSQALVNLTNSPVNIAGVVLMNRLSLIQVIAPSLDTATVLVTARGGGGVNYVVGWTAATGHTAAVSVAITMAGSAAEDYTLAMDASSGQLSVKKTVAGTLTGTTTVTVLVLGWS